MPCWQPPPTTKMCWVRTPVCNRPGQGDFLVKILGNPASLTNLCILTKKCPILIFHSGRAGVFTKVLSYQVLHKFVDTNLLLLKQLKKIFLMQLPKPSYITPTAQCMSSVSCKPTMSNDQRLHLKCLPHVPLVHLIPYIPWIF